MLKFGGYFILFLFAFECLSSAQNPISQIDSAVVKQSVCPNIWLLLDKERQNRLKDLYAKLRTAEEEEKKHPYYGPRRYPYDGTLAAIRSQISLLESKLAKSVSESEKKNFSAQLSKLHSEEGRLIVNKSSWEASHRLEMQESDRYKDITRSIRNTINTTINDFSNYQSALVTVDSIVYKMDSLFIYQRLLNSKNSPLIEACINIKINDDIIERTDTLGIRADSIKYNCSYIGDVVQDDTICVTIDYYLLKRKRNNKIVRDGRQKYTFLPTVTLHKSM